jgi:hypothetical protein
MSTYSSFEKGMRMARNQINKLKALAVYLCALPLLATGACEMASGPTSPSSVPQRSSTAAHLTQVGTFESNFGEGETFPGEEGEVGSGGAEQNEGEPCARSPGFYCQNQTGKNPNMSEEEFEKFAAEAAVLLGSVEELDTMEEVAAAVCDTSDQLLRQLATLALNVVSGRLSLLDPHANLDFPTVNDVLMHGLAVADGTLEVTKDERKEVKRMLEQVNLNVSVNEGEECEVDEQDEQVDETPTGEAPTCAVFDPFKPNKVLVCHKGKNTLSISVSAWPAHYAHGDTCGPCGGE